MTEGRGGPNEGGGGGGKRDRSDSHLYIVWSEDVKDEACSIYDTLDLCFPDTNTNKSKTTATMTTDYVDCNHYTVREGVKSCIESVRLASSSASEYSSFQFQHFLVNILAHASVL